MIKSNNQSSSTRIVAAILCSMLVILLVLYIRQTNQYSTLLRLHHGSQTSLQEKIIDIARLKNELKVKDSQCTAELETLDKEASDCETNSNLVKTEVEQLKQKAVEFEAQKGEFDASLAAEKEKQTQIQEQQQKEAETCTANQKDLVAKWKECSINLESLQERLPAAKQAPIDDKSAKTKDMTVDEISHSLKQDTLKVDEESESVRS